MARSSLSVEVQIPRHLNENRAGPGPMGGMKLTR
jgi:hypothetical protein